MPHFHVVLHTPQIPNNTGNIGRTCIAAGCSLHLIRPLAFSTSEKACRRAGLDYWPRLAPREHDSFEGFVDREQPGRMWMFSTKARRSVLDAEFRAGDWLVFGNETAGLPAGLLERHGDHAVSLPMVEGERSLNLATAVCAVVYLGIEQMVRRGELRLAADGRLPAGRTATG